MLHAFLEKNVCRLLIPGRPEHKTNSNEDAVTSMVFSPLAFMSSEEAFESLDVLLGGALHNRRRGRALHSLNLELWPAGLRARSASSDKDTRCEPDVLVTLEFDIGPKLVLLAEMKWDWRMPADPLAEEVARQRTAVANAHPRGRSAEVMVAAITKNRLLQVAGVHLLVTWSSLEGRLRSHGLSQPDRASGRWAALISRFLTAAEQTSFHGFGDLPDHGSAPCHPIFWHEAQHDR